MILGVRFLGLFRGVRGLMGRFWKHAALLWVVKRKSW